MTTPKRTHAALQKAAVNHANTYQTGFSHSDESFKAGALWLERRLKRYAKNNGRRDHVMYLMGAIKTAMEGTRK